MSEMAEVTEDSIRERLTGERMIHRLRDWSDGDTLYGVLSVNLDTEAEMGKTFCEGGEYSVSAERLARERYGGTGVNTDVRALYRATVRGPRTEPRGPDPGEPPLKFGSLEDVEILEWKQNGGGDD